VRISVITPSFRSSRWLRLCVASVADQGLPVEHLVQDAGSDDGTLDWLLRDKRVQTAVEKDTGMYDAINRGLRRATGDILAYLNCDEQYLPGALAAVAEFFQANPQVDVLFGDIVFVNGQGDYIGHRKVQTPLLHHTWTCHLSTLSCATFFRRRVVFDRGDFFDPRLRDSGDGEWVLRLLRRGVPMAALGGFTSVFAYTGDNMSQGANARREARELHRTAPRWARWMKPFIILQHRLRRLAGGMYHQVPFNFALYTLSNPTQRVTREVLRPMSRLRR
jgi:glycosyltransferase involved in cell wall biosynthesis